MIDKLGPYDLNTIITGDACELAKAIPDESVDLVFTDPVYDRIDDYRWLAETAARVLKPDGNLLCWSNGKWHYRNTRWLDDSGLIYQWTFASICTRVSAPMDGKIIAKTNHVIWFSKGQSRNMKNYLADGYGVIGGQWTIPKIEFSWGKSNIYAARCIEAFTNERAVILDPFCGMGTHLAVSKQLYRFFVAFEIDPTTADNARRRVEMTQPPLFVLQPEQAELSL